MKTPKSFADVVGLLGKPRDAAKHLGVTDIAVRQWKHRDYIPSRHWPAIVALVNRGDVTGDLLFRLECAKQERAA